MANIDAELQTIANAPKGEDVRAAIISAIKAIHKEKEYPPSSTKFVTNGTYEGGPWNKVQVDVPNGGADIRNIDDMSQAPIKDNGYYTIPKLIEAGYIPNENCIGINGFIVDVDAAGDLGEITITENGEYDPIKDGWDGYSKVYVNVFGGGKVGQTCRVRFYDWDGKLLDQQMVPYGSDFAFNGNTPTSGGTFIGWNPSVQRVTNDQDFKAIYSSGGGIEGEISDSWPTIVTRMKAKNKSYPAGSFKYLQIGSNLVKMVLLGYEIAGETTRSNGQAFSTWVGSIPVNKNQNIILPHNWYMSNLPAPKSGYSYLGKWYWDKLKESNITPVFPTWGNSLMRAHLNGDPSSIAIKTNLATGTVDAYGNPIARDNYSDLQFYNTLNNQHVPDLIKTGLGGYDLFSNMVPVKKYSYGLKYTSPDTSYSSGGGFMEETVDRIWIASQKESGLGTYFPLITKGPSNYNTLGMGVYTAVTRDINGYGGSIQTPTITGTNPSSAWNYYCTGTNVADVENLYSFFGVGLTSTNIGFCL